MSKVTDFVKRNKYWVGLGATGVATLGAIFALETSSPRREKIFEGRVGDWTISYEEARDAHYMTAAKGRVQVEYTDRDPTIGIEWDAKEPKTLSDKVELVVYQDAKGQNKFNRADIDPAKYDAGALESIFTNADVQYNGLREQIRKIKRDEGSARLAQIRDNLK